MGTTTVAPMAGADPTPRFSYLIGRTHRLVRTALEDALSPSGLTVSQYTTMSILAHQSGLSNAQLARRALVAPQATNQALAALIERGLVEQHPHSTNRRVRLIELSEEGRKLLAEVDTLVDATEEHLLRALPPAKRKELNEQLSIVAALERR